VTAGVVPAPPVLRVRVARVRAGWYLAGGLAMAAAAVAGLTIGAISIPPLRAIAEVLDHIPGVSIRSGLTQPQAAIIWDLRFPRVVLGLLVGGMLSLAGASYQGVFRNPLADPYLLGAAAGAGLGATLAVVESGSRQVGPFGAVPLFAFVGALVAVAIAYAIASVGDGERSTASLILSGVAVAAFFTAAQTYFQQRHADTLREVYSWLLGHLSTSGWNDVRSVLPYLVVTTAVLLAHRRALDVLSVGDDEAASLGLHIARTRLVVVAAASLATAAAVCVSGLIVFVGIVVPHAVRMTAGASYRVILPLSFLFGAAFLAGTDVLARTTLAPAEIPIGVVTAFLGAPFFALILRSRGRAA
jgi:iron complex transport system permease protein